jgi:hypothetical protein
LATALGSVTSADHQLARRRAREHAQDLLAAAREQPQLVSGGPQRVGRCGIRRSRYRP